MFIFFYISFWYVSFMLPRLLGLDFSSIEVWVARSATLRYARDILLILSRCFFRCGLVMFNLYYRFILEGLYLKLWDTYLQSNNKCVLYIRNFAELARNIPSPPPPFPNNHSLQSTTGEDWIYCYGSYFLFIVCFEYSKQSIRIDVGWKWLC
jgi:hypothetical protein